MSSRLLLPKLLAILITATACQEPSEPTAFPDGGPESATARVHDRVSITVPFNQVRSSVCLQEDAITITGTFHEQFTSVAVPGDPEAYHYELTDVVRGTATSSSGTEYRFLDTEHQTLSQPELESLHYTFSFPTQMLLIGKGGAPNLIVHFSEHTTVLSSGELQVSIDEIRVTCQNR